MMNFRNTAVFIGTAALVLVQPQVAVNLSPAEVAQTAKEITVLIQGPGPSGSGVIIQRKGDIYLVLTAAHVVNSTSPGEEAYVTTNDDILHDIDTRKIINLPGVDLAVMEFQSNNSYSIANIGNSGQAIQQGFFITE